MNNNRIVLILFTVMILLTGSVASVSAQQIDVENMDNAQLITLLQSIMKKLEQGEEPAAETDPAEAPAAAATTPMPMTEKGAELPEFMIYENKKMNVEALPAYMFIQPTQPPKPERGDGDTSGSGGTNTSSEDCYIYCANLDWGNNESYAQCVKEHCGTSNPPNVTSEWKQ